ncbi:AAA family ATPase [Desulfobacterales bacterium HSG16]|nr:AAA family ATPase [Desulfobacterales bacterium HSG16]
MNRRIGLCGSHRTGKTTLAVAVAKKFGIPFVKTDTSRVFAENGLHPSDPMDFKTRIRIQHLVVNAASEVWSSVSGAFITDRTPIDMMAYTLADIQGQTDVDFKELEGYIDHCFDETDKFFSHLAIIQPAIPLVYEEGKAALNLAYMEHLNILIIGLCQDKRLSADSAVLSREIINLKLRIAALVSDF